MNISKLKNFTIENIIYWPLQLKLGLMFSVFLIVLWLGGNWLLTDDMWRLESIFLRVKESKIKLQIEQQQIDNLIIYKNQLQVAQNVFFDLLGKVQATKSNVNLIDELTKIGAANGVRFKSIKSLSKRQVDDWSEQSIQLILQGDYHQLVRFLNQMNALKQLLIAADFSFERENTGLWVEDLNNKYLTWGIAIKNYDYLGKASPFPLTNKPIRYNKVISDARDIFAPKCVSDINSQSNGPLLGFPLNALHLVGTILQNDQNFALILTPMGKIYWATVGNQIGQHNGKITAISKDYIDVIETKNQEAVEEQIQLILGR